MIEDFLLRKIALLALPREGNPAIKLGCESKRMSLSDAWVTGRGSPYYPVVNRVVAVRSTSVILPPFCSVAAQSRVTVCRVAVRDRGATELVLLVAINLSQLSVIGAAKVSHFEIICRALGRIPTVVCPLSTSWFSSASVVKDPLPVDEVVDLPCVELLNENRTLIRKYPETFLCLVGLSRSFTETDVRPTLLYDNNEEMGLLNFVNSADPFKVKTGEQTLAKNEVPLLTQTEDRVISPSLQTISLVDHTIQYELNVNAGKRKKRVAFVFGPPPAKKAQTKGIIISDSHPSTAGKSPTTLRRLIRQSEQVDAGFGSAIPATKDATSCSVTPTLERALEDALHDNVRTRPPFGRFVVLSSGSADTDIPTSSQVVPLISSSQAGVSVPITEPVSDSRPLTAPEPETRALSATPSQGSSVDDFYESQTIDSATTMNVLLDHVTPPGYFAALRNQGDVGFLNAFNINSAQHICMASELRLHYEHEIMTREKFEMKFTDSVAIVQQRDAEVAELKAKLEKSESKAAEMEELRKRVSDLEAMVVVKVGEPAILTTQNAGLLEKVSALELEHDGLRDQIMGEGKRRFAERAAELDARIANVRRDMDNELYLHMLTAIDGIQQGLEAGVVHGKAGRSLTQIEAYDLEIKGKYVVAVFEFEGVSFPLLDELESLNDSPLALIMSALILKDDQSNTDATPEFAQFQHALDQVTVPVYSESGSVDREMLLSDAIPAIRQSAERRGLCPPSISTLGGASGSAPPHDSSLGVADYQVSTLVLSGDGGSAHQPPIE
ncbi:hypothetical protein Tco_1315869 [Tanacetum coccineum]